MSDILDHVIESALMNAQVYSRVYFDNAKDTNDLIVAADKNFQVIKEIVGGITPPERI